MSHVEFEPEGSREPTFIPVRTTPPRSATGLLMRANIVSNAAEARSLFRLIASFVLLIGIAGLTTLTVVAGYKTIQITNATNELLLNSYASTSNIPHHATSTTSTSEK